MTVTTADLANDSKSVLDRVISRGEAVEIEDHGHVVAEIRPKVGVNRAELLRILSGLHWTESESRELRTAMDAASEVFGYAGGN